MKKISVFIGIAFLTIAFIVGTPFEFLNSTVDTLATILFILSVLILFIILFRLARRIEKKKIKWVTAGLLTLLAIPYLWTCFWILLITGGNYHPMWQDISIYTNKNGEKIISQWRETSGSIYDYRDRKILADFGLFRISFDCSRRKLKGDWREYNIKSRTTKTVNFEKGNANE